MIEQFGRILVGVCAAAICGGIAMTLTGGGALREIIRLAAGLTVLLAVLDPLSGLRLPHMTDSALRHNLQRARTQTAQLQAEQEQVMQASVSDMTCRYIEQRAAAWGVRCQAALDLKTNDAGVLVVTRAYMTCDAAAPETITALKQMVEQECGIPQEMQTWNWKTD